MEFYQVKSGDTLSIIARDVLGDMSRWPDIARLNNLVSPYTIFPGMQLMLPDLSVLGPVVVPKEVGPPAPTTTLPTTTTPTPTPRPTLGAGLTREQWTYIGIFAGVIFLIFNMSR
jgi:LysM repeat protein